MAQEDVRDLGQEMYLQHAQKMSQQGSEASTHIPPTIAAPQTPPASTTDGNNSNPEMPADLLKFIQDVGPADKQVDKEFTTPRLLEKENADELEKQEHVRKPRRQRRRMPLMGQDEQFTTEKNTYFSYSDDDGSTIGAKAVPVKEFGLDNMELYELLQNSTYTTTDASIVDAFCKNKSAEIHQQAWTDKEIAQHKEWLKRALQSIEIPTLRMDSDGNMLGLYHKDVPGPEVKSVTVMSESKVMLVLKDLAQSRDGTAVESAATDKLAERRKERKARSL